MDCRRARTRPPSPLHPRCFVGLTTRRDQCRSGTVTNGVYLLFSYLGKCSVDRTPLLLALLLWWVYISPLSCPVPQTTAGSATGHIRRERLTESVASGSWSRETVTISQLQRRGAEEEGRNLVYGRRTLSHGRDQGASFVPTQPMI